MTNNLPTNSTHEIVCPELGQETTTNTPRKYKVIILNDDYTPMDFVVELLYHFFNMSKNVSIQIMLEIHVTGKGVCGIYTHEIAETKVAAVNRHAMDHGYPLLCQIEPE